MITVAYMCKFLEFLIKGTVMQNKKALVNDSVLKVS